MNKYYKILGKILDSGRYKPTKGNIKYLLNEQLHLTPIDLLDILKVTILHEKN